jgi:hypothetical protein
VSADVDGAFAPDGTFIPLPRVDPEPLGQLRRQLVFGLLLKHDRIDQSVGARLRAWRHSGVGAHRDARLDADEAVGVDRLVKATPQGKVLSRAEWRACRRFPGPDNRDLFNGVSHDFQVFDPLDLIAGLTRHVPEPNKQLARSFGWYPNQARGLRARGARAGHQNRAACQRPAGAASGLEIANYLPEHCLTLAMRF